MNGPDQKNDLVTELRSWIGFPKKDLDLVLEQAADEIERRQAAFKNFHRALCERFNYCHDEKDWQRDQVSLIEWIAKKTGGEIMNEVTGIDLHDELLQEAKGMRDRVHEKPMAAAYLLVHYRSLLQTVEPIIAQNVPHLSTSGNMKALHEKIQHALTVAMP